MHLTAAYDLLGAASVAGVLIVLRRRSLRPGTPTLLLAALYGTGRLAFDFLREDVRRFGLTGSQWAALLVVTGSVSWPGAGQPERGPRARRRPGRQELVASLRHP